MGGRKREQKEKMEGKLWLVCKNKEKALVSKNKL